MSKLGKQAQAHFTHIATCKVDSKWEGTWGSCGQWW